MKVLVIDDNIVDLTLCKKFLEELGHDVRLCEDGCNAMDAYKRFKPDVIILDIVMERQDGFATLRELTKMKIDCPIIMQSTKEGESDKAYAERLGAKAYIVKPPHPDKLIAALEISCGS